MGRGSKSRVVSAKNKYKTGAGVVPDKLNVHLVPHSHDDVGWLKTVDQYYVGSNQNIQAFFHRWWVEQSLETQAQVRKLVDSGQLEFVNGGWCMHDEATTHYIDMIDQTTLGHRFIKKEFDTAPRAGWQIDPFGHSAVQAYLLGAELGFESVHFARIDYQDRDKRKADKSLEVVWRGSKTFGSSAQIFANAFPERYSPPDGFNFEVDTGYEPIQDDPLLSDYNVEQRVQEFIDAATIQDGRVNVLYSTPSIYTDAKNAAPQLWPLKTHDYFPYADKPYAYWTGYFTSRPTLKGYVRMLSGYYLAEAVISSSLACLASKNSKVKCSAPASAFSQVNDAQLVVKDSLGNNLEAQYGHVDIVTANLRNLSVNAYMGFSPKQAPKYWLLFPASVPPLGWSTYFISRAPGKGRRRKGVHTELNSKKNEIIEIGQGNLKVSFSSESGQLTRMYNSKTGVPLKVIRGSLVDEVHQNFSSWIYQVTRIYRDKEHAEIEYTIGPIPMEEGAGKEVISQMTTNMVTNKEFYTDSNGRDFLKRVRDYREDWPLKVAQPIAGNYYPLNLGIYIEDTKSEFSVLVDRATGGASIKDGEVELMLHRRLSFDDGEGVDEALDEKVCVNVTCEGLTVRGKYYMSLHKLGAGSRWRRTTAQEIYSPLLLAFTYEDLGNWKSSHSTEGTVMDPNYSLPPNVALITLEELEDRRVLLRVAHLYETGEDAEYSSLTKVELKKMFVTKKIKEVVEVSLSGNQEKSKMKKKTWKVEGDREQEPQPIRGGPVNSHSFVVELGPMEIRTFLLKF
ncbi:unnamed protein product [Lupinus luteus]|uniref:alpha-mannosidase n=1 Tax=Lupinus luteus TaxID=3873 RepID=A0AAV1YD09_LUPLU